MFVSHGGVEIRDGLEPRFHSAHESIEPRHSVHLLRVADFRRVKNLRVVNWS